MKSILFLMVFLFGSSSFAAYSFNCYSEKDANAFDKKKGRWVLDFKQTGPDQLKAVKFYNKSEKTLGEEVELIERDGNFHPTDERYRNYNRYHLTDRWCTYRVHVPQDMINEEHKFEGLITTVCDNEVRDTLVVKCRRYR